MRNKLDAIFVIFVNEYLLKISRTSIDVAGIFTIVYYGLSASDIFSEVKVFLLIYLVFLAALSLITILVVIPLWHRNELKDSNLQQIKTIEEELKIRNSV